MRKRTWSLPFSPTPSTTSGTSPEGSGTAGSLGPTSAALASTPIRSPAPTRRAGFAWHCFDPDKILLDPYAKSVFFPPAFDRAAASRPGSNAGKAPLGLLAGAGEVFDWGEDRRPRHQSDTVIYELHVRGFTNNPNSGVQSASGAAPIAGLVEKIPYLKDLGVTAVELMPIFQFDPQEGNYWGYMPLSFFAPHHGYGSRPDDCDQHNEFRAMVKALHAADIEVILDVVYNHTAEGDQTRADLQLQGNRQQHLLPDVRQPGNPYANFSGTGNTLHCSNRRPQDDRGQPALLGQGNARRWLSVRPGLGLRAERRRLAQPGRPADLRRHPLGSRPGGHPLDRRAVGCRGGLPTGRAVSPPRVWFQWNGRFRDDVRRFVRGDPGLVPALMQRLYGSDDLFPDDRTHAFHPYQSVNYVTSHDGFTLYDLVSYDRKHNQANGHDNTDGPEENYSWNCGWEGDDGAPAERAGAAQATGQELLLPAAAGERHADVPRRRRVLADAGRQQQPVQPGQRDQLARLGPAPTSTRTSFGSSAA